MRCEVLSCMSVCIIGDHDDDDKNDDDDELLVGH